MSTIRDRYKKIMAATNAGIWIIGHKNSSGKHRGNELLFNNIETAIDVSVRMEAMDAKTMVPVKDTAGRIIRHAKILKQREGEAGALCDFVLSSVDIGINRYGRPRTSCVTSEPEIDVATASNKPTRPGPRPLTAHELVILQALRDALSDHGQAPPSALALPRSIATVVDARRWREAYCARAPRRTRATRSTSGSRGPATNFSSAA